MEQRKSISHITAGLIIGIVLIALAVGFKMAMGMKTLPDAGWFSSCVIVIGLSIFIWLYGKSKDNYVKFGDLFSYGFKATAIFTLLYILFLVIVALIDPNIKQETIEQSRIGLQKTKLSDDEIEKSMQLVTNYFWALAIGGKLLGFIITGAIGSLIGAAITKKRPYHNNPLDQLDA